MPVNAPIADYVRQHEARFREVRVNPYGVFVVVSQNVRTPGESTRLKSSVIDVAIPDTQTAFATAIERLKGMKGDPGQADDVRAVWPHLCRALVQGAMKGGFVANEDEAKLLPQCRPDASLTAELSESVAEHFGAGWLE